LKFEINIAVSTSSILTRNDEWMSKMNEIFINVREREKLIDGLASAYRDVFVEYNSRFPLVWCLPGLET
jgi:hypothetical protein